MNYSEVQQKIMDCLSSSISLTRDEISSKIDVPRTTIYEHIIKLVEKDIVSKFCEQKTTRGRPKVFYLMK